MLRYLEQHWRGRLTLGRSFWVNGLGLNVAFGIATFSMRRWMLAWTLREIRIASIVVLVATLCIAVWQWVGIWRAAGQRNVGPTARWLVRAYSGVAVFSFWTTCGALLEYFQDRVVAKPLHVRVLGKAGAEAELSGTISDGSSAVLRAFLDQNPKIRLLHLNSPGGLLNEGLRLARLVHDRGLPVIVDHSCASACTLVLLASPQRWARPGALIGFHQARTLGAKADPFPLGDESFVTALANVDASSGFIDTALNTRSSDIFNPDPSVLLAEHVLTGFASDEQFVYCPPYEERARLEKWLLGDTFRAAIHEVDPTQFRALLDAYERAPTEGTTLGELHRIEAQVQELEMRGTKCHDSTEHASTRLAAMRHLVAATAQRFPARCKKLMTGAIELKGLPDPVLAEANGNAAELLRESHGRPPIMTSPQVLDQAASSLTNALSPETRSSLKALFTAQPIEDAAACAAALAYYDALAGLPPEQIAAIQRGSACLEAPSPAPTTHDARTKGAQ